MSKLSFSSLIGLAGVARYESATAKKVGVILEWVMMLVAFWLPIEWYLQAKGELSAESFSLASWLLWGAFLFEAILMTALVKKKSHYILSNWFNILILIIIFPVWTFQSSQFGVLRLIRLLVLFRVIFPWIGSAHRALTLNRLGLTLVIFLVATSLSGIFLSMFDPGIKSPFLGVWWAWETVTTVGYGDVVPTTMEGKILAMIIMFVGVTLFSVVTASISAYFVGKDQTEQMRALFKKNSEKISEIEKMLLELNLNKDFAKPGVIDQLLATLSKSEKQALLKRLNEVMNFSK